MKKILSVFTLIVFLSTNAQIKILFDATKAEMAGNADWVIDADEFNLRTNSNSTVTIGGRESNPQRFPTPDQSNITSTTPENFWTGGISGWAIDLVKHGYFVETLPYDGRITYNDSTNPQDLSNYKVFIICEPNSPFSSAEKSALINFVSNGGGLFLVANHSGADRNADNWDASQIYNDFFNNNLIKTNPFGINFNYENITSKTANIINDSNNVVLNGPYGKVSQVDYYNGTTMVLDKSANPNTKGLVYESNADNTSSNNVRFATSIYGIGKVCAVGDSSVPDDGTGDPGDTLYDGYFFNAVGNHRILLLNAVIWLATSSGLATDDIMKPELSVNIYPNPSSDYVYVQSKTSEKYHLTLMDSSGKVLQSIPNTDKISITSYPKGIYYLVIKNDKGFKNFKVEKR